MASELSSICPLQFIPTVHGSSPFAQGAPLVLTANFDTEQQAQAYMKALHTAHLQFMQSPMITNPHDYNKTTQFLGRGIKLVRESWRKGDWSPPLIDAGKVIEATESNGYAIRLTRVAFNAAAGPTQPSEPAPADPLTGDQFPDANVAFCLSDDDSDLS